MATKSNTVVATKSTPADEPKPLPVRARAAGHRHGRAVGSSAGAAGTYTLGFFEGFVEGAKAKE